MIVGLGNPGKQYEFTRHNAGYLCLDYLAAKYDIKVNKIKFKSLVGEGNIKGEKVILLKPTTFINLSGEAVVEAANFYKIYFSEYHGGVRRYLVASRLSSHSRERLCRRA